MKRNWQHMWRCMLHDHWIRIWMSVICMLVGENCQLLVFMFSACILTDITNNLGDSVADGVPQFHWMLDWMDVEWMFAWISKCISEGLMVLVKICQIHSNTFLKPHLGSGRKVRFRIFGFLCHPYPSSADAPYKNPKFTGIYGPSTPSSPSGHGLCDRSQSAP